MILKATDGFAYNDPVFQDTRPGNRWRIEPTEYGMRIVVRGPREMSWSTVLRKLKGEMGCAVKRCLIPLSVGESRMAVFGDDYVKATSFDIRINEPTPVPTSFTAKLAHYEEAS